MKEKLKRPEFADGVDGDRAWAAATRASASDFVLATRQASTTVEHVSYMLEWNDLLVEEGFGSHVVEAKLGGRGEQLERWRALDQGRAGRGRPA